MSSKNRPLRELSHAPQTPRYAPSTPHAIRALQQRSGPGQRSARITKARADVRPDSARGILRRLAKITAPLTNRRISTPVGKENVQAASTGRKALEFIEGDDELDERPAFTLPMVDGNGWEDEEDSDLGEAPTPSALPELDYDYGITAFNARQSMSERPQRRASHISNVSKDGEDTEYEREVELGRRAVSEGPMERYPRSSFGSIRMSGFGLDSQGRTGHSAGEDKGAFDLHHDHDISIGFGDDQELELDNETEDFRRHRRSLSLPNELSFGGQEDSDVDNTFRLQMPHEAEALDSHSRVALSSNSASHPGQVHSGDDVGSDDEAVSPSQDSQPEKTRPLTPMEAATARRPRRKRVKLTRNGIEIPSLPSSLVRRVAVEAMTRKGKRKPVIDRASLKALEQATEWFLEQVGEDLEAYSNHAGRTKRIIAGDVLTLMRRQRVLKGEGKLGDFAIEHLPTEALLELDLPDTL